MDDLTEKKDVSILAGIRDNLLKPMTVEIQQNQKETIK